ncbi:MAG: hypothetical protein JW839_12575 [Candidatus Lokiarchaeota archaeon]|nr:hypothetical protein [Candidatus Lokiarchaeota archaeon]
MSGGSNHKGGGLARFVNASVILSRIATGTGLAIAFLLLGLFPTLALSYGVLHFMDVWPSVALALGVVALFGVLAWAGGSNRVGALSSFVCCALVTWFVWNNVMEDLDFGDFPALTILLFSLLGIVVAGGMLSIVGFICMCVLPENLYRERGAYGHKLGAKAREHKVALVLGASVIGAGLVAGLVSQVPQAYDRVVTITPQGYQAEVAFWAGFDIGLYNASVRQELNEHNATLVVYHPPNIKTIDGRNDFISNMLAWNASCPNVKLVMSIQGYVRVNDTGDDAQDFFDNTFPYDGSAEGVVSWAKDFMDLAVANNLTNFAGVNTDQEAPDDALWDEYGIDITPNATRHAEAVAIYDEFFEWRRANHPGMLVTSTMGMKAMLDCFDGDDDMQVLDRVNIFDVHGWDEIAPMIYRCGSEGTPPYGDLPRPKPGDEGSPSSYVYYQLKYLQSALIHNDGNASRLGIYLGITNLSCYGADVEQYDRDGNFVGYGYDQLVKDALIAKHFGSKIITIFILNTAMTGPGPDAFSMGGVFDSYGIDFLDNFMADINGPGSTEPFPVYLEPDLDLAGEFTIDLLYNLDGGAGLAAVLLVEATIIACSIILHPAIKGRLRASKDRN